MTVTKAVVSLLLGHTPLTAVVGDRVEPLLAKDAARRVPFLLYTADPADPQRLLDGTIDHVKQKVTITCFAKTYKDAETLGLLTLAALDNKSGRIKDVNLLGCWYDDERESTGGFDDGGDTIFYVKELDFDALYELT